MSSEIRANKTHNMYNLTLRRIRVTIIAVEKR